MLIIPEKASCVGEKKKPNMTTKIIPVNATTLIGGGGRLLEKRKKSEGSVALNLKRIIVERGKGSRLEKAGSH